MCHLCPLSPRISRCTAESSSLPANPTSIAHMTPFCTLRSTIVAPTPSVRERGVRPKTPARKLGNVAWPAPEGSDNDIIAILTHGVYTCQLFLQFFPSAGDGVLKDRSTRNPMCTRAKAGVCRQATPARRDRDAQRESSQSVASQNSPASAPFKTRSAAPPIPKREQPSPQRCTRVGESSYIMRTPSSEISLPVSLSQRRVRTARRCLP